MRILDSGCKAPQAQDGLFQKSPSVGSLCLSGPLGPCCWISLSSFSGPVALAPHVESLQVEDVVAETGT